MLLDLSKRFSISLHSTPIPFRMFYIIHLLSRCYQFWSLSPFLQEGLVLCTLIFILDKVYLPSISLLPNTSDFPSPQYLELVREQLREEVQFVMDDLPKTGELDLKTVRPLRPFTFCPILFTPSNQKIHSL